MNQVETKAENIEQNQMQVNAAQENIEPSHSSDIPGQQISLAPSFHGIYGL